MTGFALAPTAVHCDACGALPTQECRTPGGKVTEPHQDRRANADVIRRHLNYRAKAAR